MEALRDLASDNSLRLELRIASEQGDNLRRDSVSDLNRKFKTFAKDYADLLQRLGIRTSEQPISFETYAGDIQGIELAIESVSDPSAFPALATALKLKSETQLNGGLRVSLILPSLAKGAFINDENKILLNQKIFLGLLKETVISPTLQHEFAHARFASLRHRGISTVFDPMWGSTSGKPLPIEMAGGYENLLSAEELFTFGHGTLWRLEQLKSAESENLTNDWATGIKIIASDVMSLARLSIEALEKSDQNLVIHIESGSLFWELSPEIGYGFYSNKPNEMARPEIFQAHELRRLNALQKLASHYVENAESFQKRWDDLLKDTTLTPETRIIALRKLAEEYVAPLKEASESRF